MFIVGHLSIRGNYKTLSSFLRTPREGCPYKLLFESTDKFRFIEPAVPADDFAPPLSQIVTHLNLPGIVTASTSDLASCFKMWNIPYTLSRGEGGSEAGGSGIRAKTLQSSTYFRLSKIFCCRIPPPALRASPSPGGGIKGCRRV